MSTYISNRELEELGEGLTRHYLENAHVQMAARCIDIEGLANYLGMTVVFETFAEEDRDKVGFLADGSSQSIRPSGILIKAGGSKSTDRTSMPMKNAGSSAGWPLRWESPSPPCRSG